MQTTWIVLLFAGVAFAGCTDGGNLDADSGDAMTDEVDCEALLAEQAGETPEECEGLFVPAGPEPLLHINTTGCKYMATVAYIPEEVFGPPPEGLSYVYLQNDASGVIIVTAVGVDCQELEHRNGTIDSPLFFTTFVQVEPMAQWDDVEYNHYWTIAFVSQDQDVVDVYHEAGMDRSFQADVTWSAMHESEAGLVGATGYDTSSFRFESHIEASGPPSAAEFSQRFYMLTEDGDLVVFDVDLSPHSQFLGDSKLLRSPGIAGAPTPYAGIGVYGRGESEGFDIRFELLLPEEVS